MEMVKVDVRRERQKLEARAGGNAGGYAKST